jgi:hypothetical protein
MLSILMAWEKSHFATRTTLTNTRKAISEGHSHVLSGDAPVHRDVHALVAEAVGQAIDAPPRAQAFADEVHAPHLIHRRSQFQWHAFSSELFDLLLRFLHRQVCGAAGPVDLLCGSHPGSAGAACRGCTDSQSAGTRARSRRSCRRAPGSWHRSRVGCGSCRVSAPQASMPVAKIALFDHGDDDSMFGPWG